MDKWMCRCKDGRLNGWIERGLPRYILEQPCIKEERLTVPTIERDEKTETARECKSLKTRISQTYGINIFLQTFLAISTKSPLISVPTYTSSNEEKNQH